MSQSVTQKQCTESKTGLGAHPTDPGCTHGAPRLLAVCSGCARTPHVLGHVVAVPQSYRGPVSRAPGRIAGLPLAVSQPWLCCIATQPATTPSLPPFHDTILCLVTQTLSHSNLRLSRYNRVYRDTLQPNCTPLLLCHDTISIVS